MKPDDIYIVAICASLKPAPGRNEPSACREILKMSLAPVGKVFRDIRLIDLREMALPGFEGLLANEHYDQRVRDTHELIKGASGLIFSIPAYWGGVGGTFKSFVETLSGPAYNPKAVSPFANKPALSLLIGADALSAEAAAQQLKTILAALKVRIAVPTVIVPDPEMPDEVQNGINSMVAGIAQLVQLALAAKEEA
jgi:NAD(P)H-dependent FMN reductase